MRTLKPVVFWPPFLLLLAVMILSLFDKDTLLAITTTANSWILDHFGWLFSIGTLFMLLTAIFVYFSPLAKVRIGGEKAKPMLTRWRWFSITLCTTVAIGILFWGTAEPLLHLHSPPQSLPLEPSTAEAARFALSTMYFHWSFIPYAIYTVPALMFALAYYNYKQPFTLGASLTPLFGRWVTGRPGQIIDAFCLFALVAGMASSLGTGIMILAGGIQHLFGVESSPWLWAIVAIALVGTFLASAISGLMKGIRILSDINTKIFFGIALFVVVFGPTMYILSSGADAFTQFIGTFLDKSFFIFNAENDPWPKSWTVFYWANWLAWAPITALFLGRISYGYTVREFILINLVAPALFSCVWMAIFSGTVLHIDLASSGALHETLTEGGPEAVMYQLLNTLPLSHLLAVVFIVTAFLSYVTAADSNTEALGGISSTGISPDSPSPPLLIKLIWGITIGFIAWIMITFAGIDGVKMLSNMGGFPALFLILLINIALLKVAFEQYRTPSRLQSP